MNLKKSLETLKRAESLGLRAVVDSTQWEGTAATFPLNPEISPLRCDVVVEARRLADLLADRPEPPAEGCVYLHSREDLEAALGAAATYLNAAMKGKPDAQSNESAAKSDEPPADDGGRQEKVQEKGQKGRRRQGSVGEAG